MTAIATLAVIFVWLTVIMLVARSVWHRNRVLAVAVVTGMLAVSIALPALMVKGAAGSSQTTLSGSGASAP